MAFITFKGERRLADLLERAYGTGLKAADAKRAENALLAANPQLVNLRELKAGALIAVPDLPGVAAVPQAEMPVAWRVQLEAARRAMDAYRKRLDTQLDDERRNIALTTELVKSKNAKALAKNVPESAPYFERVNAATKARLAQAQERAAFVKTLAKVQADFEALAKKLA